MVAQALQPPAASATAQPCTARPGSSCGALLGQALTGAAGGVVTGMPRTLHRGCRFQLRCLLGQPLTVAAGGVVTGELRLVAHKRQSYDVHLTLSAPPLLPGDSPQTVLAHVVRSDMQGVHKGKTLARALKAAVM